jgi:hypothetical protein
LSGGEQVWDCIFKVITVDGLIRLAGFIGKSIILLVHPVIPEENNRRRSQVGQNKVLFTSEAFPVVLSAMHQH